MGRWQPDARGRLEQAALALYVERGFEQTTVAEIAKRAGLAERTFFRHYADKREVLFGGAGALQNLVMAALAAVPESTRPIEAVAVALKTAETVFDGSRRAHSRLRQTVIVSNADLRERELVKLAALAAVLAATLRSRGVAEPTATLAAETGIAVFRVAFERWLDDDAQRGFAEHLHEGFAELKAMAAGA